MPSEQHQAIVKKLKELGAVIHDCRPAMFDAIERTSDKETVLQVKSDLTPHRVTPDAYHIDHERHTVTVFEVEMFSTLTEEKLDHYINWWLILEDVEWSLRLIAVRCLANVGVCYEIDLQHMLYSTYSQYRVPTLVISRNDWSTTIFSETTRRDDKQDAKKADCAT